MEPCRLLSDYDQLIDNQFNLLSLLHIAPEHEWYISYMLIYEIDR